jgi:hypothetical protein
MGSNFRCVSLEQNKIFVKRKLIEGTRITTNPRLNFTVIVNPNSGPGTTAYPDSAYIAGVKQLNTYPNVQTVGYVHISYTARPIADVLKDVSIYSGWNTPSVKNNVNRGALAVNGIFFDETPNNYNTSTWTYLNTINAAVKSATGILGAKTVRVLTESHKHELIEF